MAFDSDGGGKAVKCNDIKIVNQVSTWATRLSQLNRQQGIVRIVTYSLPDLDYVRTQLGRRPKDVYVVANSKFVEKAKHIKAEFPLIRIAVHPEVHSKVLLVEPKTIWFSSANFGDSGWHESTIGLHSAEAHDWYAGQQFQPLWNSSTELQ